jgi:hypothetical protein
MGATAGTDALVKGYFKIKLFFQENVETCADNTIAYADVSYYYPNESRPEEFYFYVASTGDVSVPTIIPARKLITQQPTTDCEILTTLEVYYPWTWDEETQSLGVWEEVRTNDYHTQYLTIQDDMYISFDASQADYIEDIVPTFWSDEWMDTTMYDFTVPTSMMLPCRIRHFSPANGAEAHDYFYLHVYGSDETAADLCGYDDVSVADDTLFW